MNGFTRTFHNWLLEEPFNAFWLRIAKGNLLDAPMHPNVVSGTWSMYEAASYMLAATLQQYANKGSFNPNQDTFDTFIGQGGVYVDLLVHALANKVDFLEIAKVLITTIQENGE